MDRKQQLVTLLQRRLVNPLSLRMPGQAVLETTGRHSGLPRRTPVGGKRDGDTFWLVSEYGERSNYVRNLMADPRVRLRHRGHWRTGTANLLREDNPVDRLRKLPIANSAMVRLVGTNLRTIRVDLD